MASERVPCEACGSRTYQSRAPWATPPHCSDCQPPAVVAIPPELKLQALLYRWLAPHFSGEMLRFYVKDLMPKLAQALDAARQQQRAELRCGVEQLKVEAFYEEHRAAYDNVLALFAALSGAREDNDGE